MIIRALTTSDTINYLALVCCHHCEAFQVLMTAFPLLLSHPPSAHLVPESILPSKVLRKYFLKYAKVSLQSFSSELVKFKKVLKRCSPVLSHPPSSKVNITKLYLKSFKACLATVMEMGILILCKVV